MDNVVTTTVVDITVAAAAEAVAMDVAMVYATPTNPTLMFPIASYHSSLL